MKADLHIHTCLSPCGDLDMTPTRIVQRAREEGLAIIGICDHHTAGNVSAVARAAQREDLCIIPGMEINTLEEVHVVALFRDIDSALKFEQIICDHLPPEENDEKAFGMQVIANEHDEVEGFNKKLLIGSVDLSLSRVIQEVHALDGIVMAAHIDRESYSVIQQLGFIPDDLEFDALEISPKMDLASARRKYPEYSRYTFVASSDAHFLQDVGKGRTVFLIEKAEFNEIHLALSNSGERKVLMEG